MALNLDKELEVDRKRRHQSLRALLWYHGNISRNTAQTRLTGAGKKDGMYLVRQSNMIPRDYVLSLVAENSFHHFTIKEISGDLCYKVADGNPIEGLDRLIDHYSEAMHGLPTRLMMPCEKNAKLPPAFSVQTGLTNALHNAILKEKDISLIRNVLNHPKCPDINWKDDNGNTALHIACMKGMENIVRLLLEKGAEVNALDKDTYTPLHRACQNNQASMARLLLKEGKANPQKAHRPSENVPLHEAAQGGHVDTVKVLLSLNVPAWPRNQKEKTPYQLTMKYAQSQNHKMCAQLLEKYRPPPAKTDKKFWYHEKTDRQKATELLQNYGIQDGYFLLRGSSRGEGQYVLMLCSKNNINNYFINSINKEAYFLVEGPLLSSLEHFVEHYGIYPDGIDCTLAYAVAQDGQVRDLSTGQVVAGQQIHRSEVIYGYSSAAKVSLPPPPPPRPSPGVYTKIKKEDLELGAEMGQGEYGSVLKGTWLNNGERHQVAIKTLNTENMSNSTDVFLREAEVMVKFDHPCIVRLIGVCKGPPLMLIQELLPHGSLQDFLLDYPQEIDVRKDLYVWASQIASGMDYLADNGFVHRDLATRNILLLNKSQAKVGDFGLSRAVGDSEYYKATKGGRWPVKWYAPECMYYGTFSHASDVWSFGVTLWEMFSFGEQPYGDKTGAQVVQMIENGCRLEKPELCPPLVYEHMMRCWKYKADERPTFRKLHEFFSSKAQYINVTISKPIP